MKRTDSSMKSILIHESSHALDLNCSGKFTSSGKLMKISNSLEYQKVIMDDYIEHQYINDI